MTDELFPEWKYSLAGHRLAKPKDSWGDYPIDAVFAVAGDRVFEWNANDPHNSGPTYVATRTILHNEDNEYIKGWQALINEGALVLVATE